MQFLHFAFAIGAFLAPLIAHPFLINSIFEVTVNGSNNRNVSLKAILPYATTDHVGHIRTKRDFPSHTNNDNTMFWHDVEHQPHFPYVLSHSRNRRQATSPPSENVTVDSVGVSNVSTKSNDSLFVNTSTTSSKVESTTFRPKKPSVVHPLSKEHANSQLVVDKLKDLKKNPPTTVDDSSSAESDGKGEANERSKVSARPIASNVTVEENGNVSGNETAKGKSSNTSSISSRVVKTSPPSTTASSTTTTTSTTTFSTTTTSTSTTTTSASSSSSSSTTMPAITKATKKITQDISAIMESPIQGSTENISASYNNTEITRPRTLSDLVYGMLDVVRHMSKIQFAYLIIGMFLIANAGFFLTLYCQDKARGYRLDAVAVIDPTRPPVSPCFLGSLLVLLFVFFLFYVGMEQTYGILLTTFAVEYPGTIRTPAEGATITAAFWGCVAVGRGISICISRFFKAPCMLVSNLILVIVGSILLSFFLHQSWTILWVGTVFLGLGMSSLFPTTFSWADSYYSMTGRASAVFVAGSGVGQMTIPILTGFLYQNVDRMCLMYVTFTLSILLAVIYVCLQVLASRHVADAGPGGVSRSHSGFMRLHTSEDVADSLDMDLIQAGGMDHQTVLPDQGEESEMSPMNSNSKQNGVHDNGGGNEYEDTEFSRLVELSD